MSLRAFLALCVAAAIAGCAAAPEVDQAQAETIELGGVVMSPAHAGVFPGPASMAGVLPGTAIKAGGGAATDIALYDTTPTAVVDGQRYPLSLDANRNLNVVIASGGGVVDTELPAAAALSDNAANPTAPMLGANLSAWDGATWDRVTNGSGVLASALRVTIATDDPVNDALAVVGTGTATAATLRITQSTDDVVSIDLNGTAASLNSGVLDAGTQRVTIATDDEVNNLLGTIDTDTGNIATDTDSLAVVGTGAATATTLRMTLATDDELNDDADAIRVATETLDNAIAGTEMQVDVVAALPAGANNIGDVDIVTINGQAPAFGAGVVGATVQRVTVATDDVVSTDWNGTVPPIGAGTEAAALRVAIATDSTIALEAGAANIGDVDVLTINGQAPAFGAGVVGATVQRVTVSTDDVVSIDWNGTAPPIGGGVQATALRITTATDSPSVVAPDAAFPANTLAISARASTAKPTAMSGDGDASGIWTSRVGSVRMVSGEVAYITTTTLGADLAAVGANTGNRLVVVTVRETAGAAARVMVRNGAADTGTLIAAISLAANGADTITFSGGINCDSGVFLDWITGAMEITVGTEDHE